MHVVLDEVGVERNHHSLSGLGHPMAMLNLTVSLDWDWEVANVRTLLEPKPETIWDLYLII